MIRKLLFAERSRVKSASLSLFFFFFLSFFLFTAIDGTTQTLSNIHRIVKYRRLVIQMAPCVCIYIYRNIQMTGNKDSMFLVFLLLSHSLSLGVLAGVISGVSVL